MDAECAARCTLAELISLPLRTADGRPLVHKFYRHPEGAAGLLVIFPGNHYGVDGPLLYYPGKLLGAEGWDTLAVSYGFQTTMGEPFEAGLEALVLECGAALAAALEGRQYPRVALVGKSMGAGIVAYLCGHRPELASARAAYLNPPLGTPFFDPFFEQTRQPSYLVLGTLDRYYSAEALERLKGLRPFELALIDGADHSLDVPGDLSASIEAVGRAVTGLLAFLRSSH